MAANASPSVTSAQSQSIADLAAKAAEVFGDRVAVRHKTSGTWEDVTFSEVWDIASEIGRGLIDLGIEPGQRVAILCNTRPEWTYSDFGIVSAGLVVVPIYPTNSPEECEWVLGNSESIAVVCENESQLAKVREVRDDLPHLKHVIVVDGTGAGDEAITLEDLRERGRSVDLGELRTRYEAVGDDDPFTFIYTSGTTGPPKGCVLTHGNYRGVLNLIQKVSVIRGDDVSYLYLPLAHSFALLIQLGAFDLGATIAYFGGDPKQIIPELSEVKPTYFPSVPRVFEKLYTLVTSNADPEQLKQAVAVGRKVRQMEVDGEDVPDDLRKGFEQADELLFSKVRAAFGGNVRQCVTGAAPIAQEILEFFFACGVPVLEGYGMTETSTVATYSTIEDHRFGTVGKALPGCEIKIADDGEVLIKGVNIFQGYYRDAEKSFGTISDGWLHTGDLGSLDEDGFLKITGRKKDIIITAGGKNITPANLENDLKQSRWISQAVMHGDRRPYCVALITLDEEEVGPWAKEKGIDGGPAELAKNDEVIALIQGVLDSVNSKYARVEQIKKFCLLGEDLSQETGELTPTLKVKRNVVNAKYAGLLESLYS